MNKFFILSETNFAIKIQFTYHAFKFLSRILNITYYIKHHLGTYIKC